MLIFKNFNSSINRKSKPFDITEIPNKYTLGKGHVKFFYNKFKFLYERHLKLTNELKIRGFNLNFGVFDGFRFVGDVWYNDWTPSKEDLILNRQRLKIRMPKNAKWSKK